MSTDPKWHAFAARLAAKLGMDPEHQYWVSHAASAADGFVDVTVTMNGAVVFGGLHNSGYHQYKPLTLKLLQDHFGNEIVVHETDPTVLADHFSDALLNAIRPRDDTTLHLSYDSTGLSFLGVRPLELVKQETVKLNDVALQLIMKLKDGRGRLPVGPDQLKEAEAKFLHAWSVKPSDDATERCAGANEETVEQPDGSTAKRQAVSPPTKKTVKRPKMNKKKKKVAGLKFEGED